MMDITGDPQRLLVDPWDDHKSSKMNGKMLGRGGGDSLGNHEEDTSPPSHPSIHPLEACIPLPPGKDR